MRGGQRIDAEIRVDEYDVGAHQGSGEEGLDEALSITAHDPHRLTGSNATAGQLAGQGFGLRPQLAVGEGAVVIDDCAAVRPASRRDRQQGVGIRATPARLANDPESRDRGRRAEQS